MTSLSPRFSQLSSRVRGRAGDHSGVRNLPPLVTDLLWVLVAVALGLASRAALGFIVGERQPFITVYPLLLGLALFCSMRSALIYAILAAILHQYYFIAPRQSFRFGTAVDAVVVLAFVMVVAMILGLANAHRREQGRLVREIQERARAEAKVRELNAHLEERVRLRTKQLEEANRELEAFSYSVSHDLRAPLRHIAGFTDMLDKRIGASLDEGARRYMGIIQDAVSRAGSLVDDLLAFSRMGRADLMESRVTTSAMVHEVVREFEEESARREIIWDIRDPLPDVFGDPAMLRQVWRNLIGNAVKYTRQQREPVISIGAGKPAGAEYAEGSAASFERESVARPDAAASESESAGAASTADAESDENIVFFVRDNGVGFDMKYSDKLFGVFQRLHRPDEFEGTGIGLANIRRIIQRHGGLVWAQAAPGKGATFFFSIPARRGRSKA